MRVIESFSQWSQYFAVNESKNAAKIYMQKNLADSLKKSPSELTQDEIQKALSNPEYLQIVKMTDSMPGYTMPFVKFYFEHGVSMEKLQDLFNTLKSKKHLLQGLSRPVEQWANVEKVGMATGFEQLTDEIRTLEREKEARWLGDDLPARLRAQYRELPKEMKNKFITLAHSLKELDKKYPPDPNKKSDDGRPELGIISRLFVKIKAMTSWSIEEVFDYMNNYVKGFNNLNVADKILQLESLEPEAGLLYLDDEYMVLSMRTENSQKQLCSIANWCINRGSFSNYADNAVQINIFNFSLSPTDPMHLTGTTVDYRRNVTASHDINDKSIIRSKNAAEHFIKLGYPKKLVDVVMRDFDTEVMIKKIVYGLSLDRKKVEDIVLDVIKQSYIISADSQEALQAMGIALSIIDERVKSKLTLQQIIDMYRKNGGILSPFSVKLFKLLTAGAPENVIEEMIALTLKTFNKYQKLAEADPIFVTPTLKKVLMGKSDTLRALGIE